MNLSLSDFDFASLTQDRSFYIVGVYFEVGVVVTNAALVEFALYNAPTNTQATPTSISFTTGPITVGLTPIRRTLRLPKPVYHAPISTNETSLYRLGRVINIDQGSGTAATIRWFARLYIKVSPEQFLSTSSSRYALMGQPYSPEIHGFVDLRIDENHPSHPANQRLD